MTIRRTDPRYKALKRPCATCEKYFRPSGVCTKHCNKCLKKKRVKIRKDIRERFLKRKQNEKIQKEGKNTSKNKKVLPKL